MGDAADEVGRVACALFGVRPGDLAALGLVPLSCRVEAARIELALGWPGGGITVFVGPRDDAAPAYKRTKGLNLGYRADPAPPWLTRLVDRAAKRLERADFGGVRAAVEAELPRPVVAVPDAPPPGTPPGKGRPADPDSPAQDAEYVADGLHESWAHPDRWRLFLADTEIRRGRDSVIRADLPWAFVEHGDLECQHVGTGPFVCFPWRAPFDPPMPPPPRDDDGPRPGSRSYVTDMMDVDAIHGALPKFEALFQGIRCGLDGGETRDLSAIVVNCTCLPMMIGDEPDEVVRDERGRCPIPILYKEQDVDPYGAHVGALAGMLRDAPPVPQDPDAVNLVGFRPGAGHEEIRALLGRMGLRVNVSAIPVLSPPMMSEWRRAPVQVVADNAEWHGLRSHLLSDPGVRELVPAPPYGPAATIAWLRAVAEATGRLDRCVAGIDALSAAASSAWAGRAAEAAARGVGIVADARHVPRLTDPARNWGLPLLALLDEMGFRVRVAVFDRDAATATSVSAIRAVLPADARHEVVTFRTQADLSAFLASPDLDLVYSDYRFDHRVTSAGKASFAADAFEMGIEGGLRSLDRLLALCRLPFYREHARHLRRTP